MDGTSYFPSRPEMERNLATFVERTGPGSATTAAGPATRREDGPDGGRFVLETTRWRVPRRARSCSRSAWPSRTRRRRPGSSWPPTTPTRARPSRTPAGGSSSWASRTPGFELATGLLPWARRIVLCSPSPAKLSVNTRSLVGVRARYVQPFEDHVLGGGVAVLDASIGGIERGDEDATRRSSSRVRPSDGGEELDDRGRRGHLGDGLRRRPLLDLPDLGVATFGQAGCRPRRRTGRARPCPGSSSRARSGRGRRG